MEISGHPHGLPALPLVKKKALVTRYEGGGPPQRCSGPSGEEGKKKLLLQDQQTGSNFKNVFRYFGDPTAECGDNHGHLFCSHQSH
jgi:hypothetical protein